jgi:hypothetical protein
VYRSLRWLGTKPDLARTPTQAAALLTSLLPACAVDLQLLLHEYEHTLFSTRSGDGATARRAADTIRRLALRAAVTKRLNAVRRVFIRRRARSGERSGDEGSG